MHMLAGIYCNLLISKVTLRAGKYPHIRNASLAEQKERDRTAAAIQHSVHEPGGTPMAEGS